MTKKWSKFLAAALVVVSTSAMLTVSFDAEARRMGGGASFGRQSSNVTQKRAATTPPAAANTTQRSAAAGSTAAATGAAAQKSGFSRFLGPIAGIAAGLGIAALLSSMGLGGAFLEFLSSAILIGIVIFAIMFIVRRLRGGAAKPAMQGAGGNNMYRQNDQQPMFGQKPAMPANATPATAPAAAAVPEVVAGENPNVDKSWFVPADFDTPAFLQNAKEQFKAIQGIWDKGDIAALKEYLTDDLIAELSPQITARAGQSVTEVVLLNAELLGIEQVSDGYLASVRFSGMLREEVNTAAFRFEEVWNLYKPEQGGWLLAGIQQIPVEYAS
ncbi:39S ribosomal protein L45 [Advenella alkanexedens]|jgi:predicted lipid-binding transport protein (Tim44 family)|uniref:39S ribosomal protein L45 n=1 Tax=Advenella alkanexedens TaxID=1481665 RepID=A0ABS6NR18_9BURK|nr:MULTISPECIES: TIM44-like domain-containing protein [Advenella]MBV4398082.1 39S ribosomal protein L45 [Advenella alkanexedens]MDD3758437.1 TIM44-like domain-containing protein [Advenella sp.]NLN67049.1 Tim44 domain-containing protein [Alcaligenaceae bacterium]